MGNNDEKKVVLFSASELIKQSTKQILFLRNNPDKKSPVSKDKILGTEEQLKNSSEKNMLEMRGIYPYQANNNLQIKIFFSIDEVEEIKINEEGNSHITFIERKSIIEGKKIEDWYFKYSLLQTAFYHSLGSFVTHYETSKFFVQLGNEKKFLNTKNKFLNSRLVFGKDIYRVDIRDFRILQFYIKKALSSLESESAKKFDEKYKFKEFQTLQSSILYEKLN